MIKNTSCPFCGRYNIRKNVYRHWDKKSFFFIECVKCHHRSGRYPNNRIGNIRAVIDWKWQEFKAWKKRK